MLSLESFCGHIPSYLCFHDDDNKTCCLDNDKIPCLDDDNKMGIRMSIECDLLNHGAWWWWPYKRNLQ